MSDTIHEPEENDKKPLDPLDEEEIEVRLIRKVKKVKIIDETGTERNCTMKEMVGPDRDTWLNFAQKRTVTQNGQPVGMSEYKGMQAKLISFCLFDEEDKKFKEDAIDKWPVTAKDILFNLAQRMNGLDKLGADQAKNS